mmetsp:Transcript_57577/g.106397  ORF Transcript_57577/g.106397 Transcript_57577/m.106397 type:complete len:92 (+) Transcript_57577:1060-1335(+)
MLACEEADMLTPVNEEVDRTATYPCGHCTTGIALLPFALLVALGTPGATKLGGRDMTIPTCGGGAIGVDAQLGGQGDAAITEVDGGFSIAI